jgi:predicted nucleic acid-binding protein
LKSNLVLLDSSVWIEVITQGKLYEKCMHEKSDQIIVPTLVLFEVYRKLSKNLSEDKALIAIAMITQNQVQDMTQEVALTAADLSLEYNLGMADSLILAHSRIHKAKLITLDNDFSDIKDVKVIR